MSNKSPAIPSSVTVTLQVGGTTSELTTNGLQIYVTQLYSDDLQGSLKLVHRQGDLAEQLVRLENSSKDEAQKLVNATKMLAEIIADGKATIEEILAKQKQA